jgi:hypothetical protein
VTLGSWSGALDTIKAPATSYNTVATAWDMVGCRLCPPLARCKAATQQGEPGIQSPQTSQAQELGSK